MLNLGKSVSERIDRLVDMGAVSVISISPTQPAGVRLVSIEDLEKEYYPLYKRPWFLALAGTALVGGAYMLVRRRKA